MTLAYWCVLLAGVMPILLTGVAKVVGGRYNNRNPRAWQGRLEGRALRAHAAHLNSFEAFPLFAAGVIVAHLAAAEQNHIDALAVAFIVLRLIYAACYIADQALARSLVWLAAFACSIALFVIGV
ncbi:MAG: MAPEG family protein [Lysobacteraceae bacterium]|jgi:uncharacterized MAPEG superfamily protein